ncbi:MAG: class 1 fructose-bisphosphatase, partial [Nitrospiraceae bacterium]
AQIGLVGKLIAQDLRRAGLINILGTTGEINVQGETVKKLDKIANETFLKVFDRSGLVCALASEEMEKPVLLPENWPQAKHMLLFDPLDGSSNTDCNMPLGAIFSVMKSEHKDRMPTEDELVRKGTEQVAAGYLLYGSSTMLVYTVGQGVHGFTLEPGIGEYLLSHEQIRIPARGKIYGTNEGNYHKWTTGTKKYVDYLKVSDQATGRPYSGRYSGCLVADVHRILLEGGIYLYPGELDKPEGKLRLLYETNPLAWVVEQAGGRASTGTMRILDVEAKQLHQRAPLIIGSANDVRDAEEFIQDRREPRSTCKTREILVGPGS